MSGCYTDFTCTYYCIRATDAVRKWGEIGLPLLLCNNGSKWSASNIDAPLISTSLPNSGGIARCIFTFSIDSSLHHFTIKHFPAIYNNNCDVLKQSISLPAKGASSVLRCSGFTRSMGIVLPNYYTACISFLLSHSQLQCVCVWVLVWVAHASVCNFFAITVSPSDLRKREINIRISSSLLGSFDLRIQANDHLRTYFLFGTWSEHPLLSITS